MSIAMLLVKVSALFALALVCLPLMRKRRFDTTAAIRHLVCAMALAGALVMPLTLAFEPKAIPVQVPVVFVATVTNVAQASGQAFPIQAALLALWAAGAFLFLLRLGIGHRRVALIVRCAEKVSDAPPVHLADVSVPLICGLFRTAILLPREAAEWPEDQRSAALRHELAHLQRRDLWTSLIAHVTCAVYWFHPLAWALARELREEQEDACDDAVLSGGFEPATYAEALVATAQHLRSPSLIGCHMLSGKSLKNRISRLLDINLPRAASGLARGRTAVLSGAALALIGLVYAQTPVIRTEVAGKAPERPNSAATFRSNTVMEVPADGPPRYVVAAPKALGMTKNSSAQSVAEKDSTEQVFNVGPEVRPPAVIRKVDPEYTEEARGAKISGTVLLSVVVGSDGLAHDINVIETPDAGLGTKAVEAVQQWKFRPGTKDGEPVSVKARIEVNFRLL